MARKSKRDDLAPSSDLKPKPIVRDAGRQPRIVGWLVLIVGGFSSWFWYKPLPNEVQQTVHSTDPSSWATSKSGPRSLWTEQSLILPSTDGGLDELEFKEQVSNLQNDDSRLIGTPKVTLMPWSETQHDIRDSLKTERIPMIPVAPDSNDLKVSMDGPKIWTPDQQRTHRSEDLTQSNSNWPDSGYVPQAKIQKNQRRSAVQITAKIPTLLETGLKSIRTNETEEPRIPINNVLSETLEPTPPAAPDPARQPQFIRQPRKHP